MSDIVPDMKKITSREFQKSFSKLSQRLKPGEAVEVTRRGKALGTFAKASVRSVPLPNFLEDVKRLGHGPKVGASILKRFHDSLY